MHGLFSLLFPDRCRICDKSLHGFTRIPVCSACLAAPEPLSAEYFCVSCRTAFQNAFPLDENGRCGLCRAGLRGFDAAYSFGAYEGTLRHLIHLFKYSGMRPLSDPLGRLLSRAAPLEQAFDAVVPLPLHWMRRFSRGFNQSELLAQTLAKRLGAPLVCAVRRRRATHVQAGLSNAARRRNVDGAFAVSRAAAIQGKRVLLVDDVMTTGATASACARALKRAGAASVVLITLARVDRRLAEPVLQAKSLGAS